jgi:hypothetical protein
MNPFVAAQLMKAAGMLFFTLIVSAMTFGTIFLVNKMAAWATPA